MADERLRRLERSARPGDAAARARLLLARVRVGELSPEQLGLAAYAGDPAARELLGDEAPELPTVAARSEGDEGPVLDQRRWVSGLRRYPQEVSVRAAVALARSRLAGCGVTLADDDRPSRALRAAEAWLEQPGPEARRAAATAYRAALTAVRTLAGEDDAPGGRVQEAGAWAGLAMGAASAAAHAAAQAARAAASSDAREASACVLDALSGRADTEVIREALRVWALGDGEPSR